MVALALAACSPVLEGGGPTASVSITGSELHVPDTKTFTSTTVVEEPTSNGSDLISLTPNVGNLQVIVPVDAVGSLPGDTLIGCVNSGASFPVSALDEVPFLSESGLSEVEEAIRPFLESEEGAYWPQDDWRVLYQTDDLVLLVHSGDSVPDLEIAFMSVEQAVDVWLWAGASMSGGCPLEVKTPEQLNAVEWRFDPSAEPLTSESTVIHVLVTERACASGQTMGDRLRGPEVLVTDTELLIAFAAEPQGGGLTQTCQGNPEEPVTIEMSEPIGTRVVVDGQVLEVSLEDLLRN